MSETWADAQFDMLEAAYDEVPIEAKARIAELERELRKSYDAQGVKAEELTRRGVLLDKLEDLAIDLYCQLLNAYDAKELDEFAERMRAIGIEVDCEG